MAHEALESGESNNHEGRPYGTVLRTKNYPNLHPVLRQIEDQRLRLGWTQDRLDFEAGRCPSSWRQIVNGRGAHFQTIARYATALGFNLTLEPCHAKGND
jgi:hypothetical protein